MRGEYDGGSGDDAASRLGVDGLVDATAIGEGGNAIVYQAYQPSLDRHVAVKVLKGLVDDDARRRFDRERRAMGRLSEHEGIVTVYESGFTARGEPYLVMPLLPGSLEDGLRSGPLPWTEAVEVMAQVCDTVGIAHERGVVHRDLKPGNIMRSSTGRPLVADFGIARLMDASSSFKSTALTLTPAYSPPEALESTLASARADVYSLGATLFALIAGHAPFTDPDADSSLLVLMRRILEEPIPDLRPAIPDSLQAVLERSMAKEPAERFDDAGQLATALRRLGDPAPPYAVASAAATRPVGPPAAAGASPPAPPPAPAPAPGAPSPDGPTSSTRRRSLLLVGALVCSIVALIAIVLMVGLPRNGVGGAFGSDATERTTVPSATTKDASAAPPASDGEAPSDDAPAPTPFATSTPVPDPTVTPQSQQPPVTIDAARVGPSDFEPYATTILVGEGQPWTVVPRAGETILLVDPVALDAAQSVDLGFFAPVVAVEAGWIAGVGTEGQLGVTDLASGEVVRTDLDRRGRHLATDGDVLWVVTAEDDGSGAMLHRFDRRTLAEEAATEVGDLVLHLDVADGLAWTAAGSAIKAFDTATLDLVVETTTGVSPIDDIDAFGEAVWISGGVFASELADLDLARGSVVRIDASTGAASPVRSLTDGLSIFEAATVAATNGGAWVTIETTNEAFFVSDDGSLGPVLELPDDVQDAEVIGNALWVLAGGSGSGQLWAIKLPAV